MLLYFQIPGYSFAHVCRSDKTGGGVALYVKEELDSKIRDDLSGIKPGCESIFFFLIAGTVAIIRKQ